MPTQAARPARVSRVSLPIATGRPRLLPARAISRTPTVRLTDSPVGNRIGQSATQTGAYNSIGGTVVGSTILSSAITSLGYYVMGTVNLNAGTYTVGGGGTYATIGAAIADFNSKTITGHVVFNLTDTSYSSETLPITISANPGSSASNYLTIKANTTATISGSNATAIFDLNGASYVTIEGSNTGLAPTPESPKGDLTISNTSTSGSVIRFINAATNNTVQNAILQGVSTSTANGVVFFSTVASGVVGNSNNTIKNNDIRGGATAMVYGLYNLGTSTAKNANNVITQNRIFNFSTNGIRDDGNSSSATYSANEIFEQAAQTTALVGFRPSATSVDSFTFTGNYIHDLNTSSTTTVYGIHLFDTNSAAATCVISNNIITLSPTAPLTLRGIYDQTATGEKYNIYGNSIFIGGTVTGASTSEAYYWSIASTSNVRDNIFVNARAGGTGKHYAYRANATLANLTSDYNDIYNTGGTGNVFGNDGTADRVNLAAWRTATGKDGNSVSADPVFVSATDLHLSSNSSPAANAGTNIAGITVDIDGDTRSAIKPDIGADEVSSNKLANLVPGMGSLTPPFAPDTISYTMMVSNAIDSITFTPTVLDTNATVTVNGNAVTSGTPSGPISLDVGDNIVSVVVTPEFGPYPAAPAVTGKTYTVTVTRAAPTYTVTYDGNGNTGGTAPIDGSSYLAGATVTVLSEGSLVQTGYTFAGWNTAANGSGTSYLAGQMFAMPANNLTLYAQWTINTYTLTYTAGMGGSISGTTPQTVNYGGSGTTVTAVPSTGYSFTTWSDGVLTAARTDTNVMADVNATAMFAINTYTLTYTAGANGSIVGTSPQTVDYGANGTLVTATPDTGYHFVSWSDGYPTAARTDMSVMADVNATATFAINTYMLTYTAGANGSISGTTPQTVNYGASGTAVTAVPDTGYHFVNWSDASTDNPRTDTNVMANISVTANFAMDAATDFTINDVTQAETNSGQTAFVFTVTKTGPGAASVDFETQNGTATLADNDYQSNTGTLTFGPTDTSMQITVMVNGDTTPEPNETFTVHLLNATGGATISDADGVGTITNDDGPSPIVYVNASWAGTTPGTDPDGAGPATSFGFDSFATIQDGVSNVAPSQANRGGGKQPATGPTVIVLPGTYPEAVTVSSSMTIMGPQAGQNANTRFAAFTPGVNGPKADPAVEAIVTAAATAPGSAANDTFHIMADDVVVDGFVFDGNNPSLGQGGAVVVGGINTDSRRAIQTENAAGAAFAVNNLTVQYNVIQNFAQRGVELINGTASNTAPATSGNVITRNLVRNFGLDGIVMAFNAYADVTFNTVVTNDYPTEAGIWVQDFLNTGTPHTMNITDNDVTVGQDNFGGIWVNLAYLATVNVSNNTVNAAAAVTSGDDYTYGIYMTSLRSGTTASLNSNIVGASGGQFDRGIALWNVGTSPTTTTVTGGTVGHSDKGISLVDNDANFLLAGSNAAAKMSGVAIAGTTVGVLVDATGSTGDTVALEIYGNTSVSGGTTGISVSGANASANIHDNAASIHDNTVGIDVSAGSATIVSNNLYANGTGLRFSNSATGSAHFNRIISTTTAIDNPNNLTLNLENNWWGCNAGPGNAGCGAVTGTGADFDPWIVLGASAAPDTINPGGASTITADMTHNSDNAVPSGSVFVPEVGVDFTALEGTMNPTSGTITSGQATSMFTSTSSNNGSATATVDNESAKAVISITTYTLTYTAGMHGSISGTTPQTVTYGGDGTPVTAVPDTGYSFVNWSDASTDNPRTDMNVTADVTVTANFAINTYTLTYTAGANGSIVGTSPQTVDYGANGTLVTATPDTGYHFVSWSDGYPTAARTDMNVMADVNATATFAINTYTVTYDGNGNTGGTAPVDGNSPYNYNSTVTVLGNTGGLVKTGYVFLGWNTAANGSGTSYSPAATFSITANTTLYAQWTMCGSFSTVYVDASWAGTTPGTDPDGAGPATSFGCDSFATIQDGVNAVTSGGTVNVLDGLYRENVIITKALTLNGAGEATVTLQPAISDPNCGGAGGGSLCGNSNLILVQADNVTITGLTLDGDNPTLTSGTVVGGADIDARNGIITNHNVGTFTNLVVHHTTVKNVYLRGIYASSGGTFNFHHNTVQNVQADYASIAMFNFGGSGVFDHNNVSAANDAISSNHSRGVQFTNNTVTTSGSGVHTDNAGDGGGTADVISDNTITNSQVNGYGIFVFVPYKTVTVQNNTVTNVDVGMATFGMYPGITTVPATNGAKKISSRPAPRTFGVSEPGSVFQARPAGVPPAAAAVFTDNLIDGTGNANPTGVYFSTSQLGYGSADVRVTFTSNTVINNVDGFYLESETGFNLDVAASFNRIVNNSNSGVTQASGAGYTGTLNGAMENNWWGCNAGPNNTGCGSVSGAGVDFNPWIVLGASAAPDTINPGGVSTITADMTHNSDNAVPSGSVFVPEVGVDFTALEGTMNPTSGTITSGQASSMFTSTSSNNGSATATVDNESAKAVISITTYTLTYTAGAHGSISGTSPQTVTYGGDGTPVTAVPDTGYSFVNWSDSSTDNPRTDMNVMADVTVTANFAINTYTLTYTAGANGSISGTTPQMVNYGADGTAVTAVPDTGYHFVNWSDASTDNPRTDMNVMADVNATATFAINTYTVTYDGNGNTGGTAPVDPNSPYNYNSTVTVLGNTGGLVKTGYVFLGWNTAANGSGTSYSPAATFSIMADTTLYAQWAIKPNLVYVDDNWVGTPPGTDPDGVGPATNFGYDSFATIQDGVNGVADPGTVIVYAGTYPEAVTVDKSLNIMGAQAGQDANVRFSAFVNGPNGPKADPAVESILTAAATDPANGANDTLHVMANNVTFNGFVVDGNNPSLPQGGATVIGGINTDSRRAIQTENAAGTFFSANNVSIGYNIIQNFAQRGVELVNPSDVSPATSGSVVTRNLVRNFGLDGIVLAFNAYGDVTFNRVVTNDYPTEAGIWVQDFPNNGVGPKTINITNNDVTVGQDNFGGIWINLVYAPAATINIDDNAVNAAVGVTGASDFTYGIYLTSLQGGTTASLSGNTVGASGGQFARGVALWNLPTTTTTIVKDGSVGNSIDGISLHYDDPNFGAAGASSAVNASGMTVAGASVGLLVDATGSGANTVTMTMTNSTLSGNTAANGGGIHSVGTGGISLDHDHEQYADWKLAERREHPPAGCFFEGG